MACRLSICDGTGWRWVTRPREIRRFIGVKKDGHDGYFHPTTGEPIRFDLGRADLFEVQEEDREEVTRCACRRPDDGESHEDIRYR